MKLEHETKLSFEPFSVLDEVAVREIYRLVRLPYPLFTRGSASHTGPAYPTPTSGQAPHRHVGASRPRLPSS